MIVYTEKSESLIQALAPSSARPKHEGHLPGILFETEVKPVWDFVIPNFERFLKELDLSPADRKDADSKAERIARSLFAKYYPNHPRWVSALLTKPQGVVLCGSILHLPDERFGGGSPDRRRRLAERGERTAFLGCVTCAG